MKIAWFFGVFFEQVGGFKMGTPPARVCFLCPNDVSYVVTQWATWMAGGIAVPLCTTHPPNELKYFVEDADCKVTKFIRPPREKHFQKKPFSTAGPCSMCQSF